MQTIRDTDQRTDLVETLFHGTGEDYDKQVHLTTYGLDNKWKEALLRMVDAHEPKRILDLACGTGILSFAMLGRYPEATVTGVELRDEYLQVARARAEEQGVAERASWVLSRAENAPLDGRSFDTVTSCYIPKYADLPVLTAHMAEVMEPGGFIALQDFSYPKQKWAQDIWHRHFEKVLELCNKEYPHWVTMFEKLPDVIKESTWIDDLQEQLYVNGFTDIGVTEHNLGAATTVSAYRPGERLS